MSEHQPEMRINTPGGEIVAVPDNTSLFKYLGRIACYSHIFIRTEEAVDNVLTGTYIFANHNVFPEMEEYMLSEGYPAHINMREVAECDKDAFNKMVAQSAEDIDEIPSDWFDEDGTSKS